MLAAGGRSAKLHLWDARATVAPIVSLPTTHCITAVHCNAATHCLMAGTRDGAICTWDLRQISTQGRQPQVFGARGAQPGAPLSTCHLADAVGAFAPTQLPQRSQLEVCAAHCHIERNAEPDVLRSADLSERPMQGKHGLLRSSLAHDPPVVTSVTQLLPDPADSRRVAFALRNGIAGAAPVSDVGQDCVLQSAEGFMPCCHGN